MSHLVFVDKPHISLGGEFLGLNCQVRNIQFFVCRCKKIPKDLRFPYSELHLTCHDTIIFVHIHTVIKDNIMTVLYSSTVNSVFIFLGEMFLFFKKRY